MGHGKDDVRHRSGSGSDDMADAKWTLNDKLFYLNYRELASLVGLQLAVAYKHFHKFNTVL
jgi:hypothetical protein